jgi:ABC-2 type transport system ATP-binding protein/lipopolysaccharide transport system ATP-binding protein
MAWIEVDQATIELPVFDGRLMSLKLRALNAIKHLAISERRDAEQDFIRALDNISFRAVDGDRIGLVGTNGAGKTTLLRMLAGIYEPTRGLVRSSGRSLAILNPALGIDGEATGVENIYLRGYALGMTRNEIREVEAEIGHFTELGGRLHHPVRTYSAGMTLRLAFSISLMAPHDIMLIDEVIGVGDAGFIDKARARLTSAVARSRIVVVASHALDMLEGLCNKAIYLRQGRIVTFGPVAEVISAFRQDVRPSD